MDSEAPNPPKINEEQPAPVSPEVVPSAMNAPPREPLAVRVFYGPEGIRAGWRLVIFFVVLTVVAFVAGTLLRLFMHMPARKPGAPLEFRPVYFLVSEWVGFFDVLIAALVMSKVERRQLGEYGLPRRGMFGGRFWEGAVLGFAGISVVLLAMRAGGNFYFGTVGVRGLEAWKYAGLYALLFLATGFFEEYSFRGYPMFTLTKGVGFVAAAIIVSASFGFVHAANPGETPVGLVSVALFSLTFCWVLLRTGDLWLAVGFHMTWDWGESYFYGVPDSGIHMPGHLLNPSFQGPVWLTGGSVGPEASIYCPIVLVLVALWVTWRYRGVRYEAAKRIAESGDRVIG